MRNLCIIYLGWLLLLPACAGSYLRTDEPSGKIAYTNVSDNESHILIYDFQNGTTISLMEGGYDEYFPSLSPDGSKLAFSRFISELTTYEVFVLDLVSTEEARVSPDYLLTHHPEWSFNGEVLSLQTGRGLHTVELDSGKIRDLIPDKQNYMAAWHPDENLIALTVGGFDLYIFDVDRGSVTPLLETDDAFELPLDWSPDGRSLLFSSTIAEDPYEGERLYILDTKTKDVISLFEDEAVVFPYQGSAASWSPDGNWIAVEMDEEICIVDLNGNLWGCIGVGEEPDWGP